VADAAVLMGRQGYGWRFYAVRHRRADVAADHGRMTRAATEADAVSAMAVAGLGGYPDARFRGQSAARAPASPAPPSRRTGRREVTVWFECMNAPDATPPDVSLVVPVRNEAGNIGPLVAEIRAALDGAGISWEAFAIDDGSTDSTWDEIGAVSASEPRLVGVRRSPGAGKSAALMDGFERCRAPRIVMLDGDGQDDPAEIPAMLALLADPHTGRSGADVVNGWKTPRLDPWHKTLPSRVFNLLVGWGSGLWLHDHNCGLKVFRAEAARSLRLGHDMHRFITILAAADGHRVVEKAVHHRPRTLGRSKYGFARFFTGLLDLARITGDIRRRRIMAALPAIESAPARRRRHVAAIMAVVALGSLLGRIGAVTSVDKIALEKRLVAEAITKAREAEAGGGPAVDAEAIADSIERGRRLQRPFLSANDRSRWLAVRALVERGTFAIDEIVTEPGWDTIDAVAHADASGRIRLYSSKPPLLAVLCAAPYFVLAKVTGWTLGDHPFEMARMLLVVCCLLPLGLLLLATARMIEAVGGTDWGRLWGMALISFGTLLSTFAVSLTNHLPAATAAAWSGWWLMRIVGRGGTPAAFAAAGGLAALTAAFELPALAWCVAILGMLFVVDQRRTLTAAAPAALVVAVLALGTNWLAHGSIFPPYAHRGAAAASDRPTGAVTESGTSSANPDNWYDYSIALSNGKQLTSYWRDPKGVDRGEPSASRYAWHATVGHHGIFSLTPAWLLLPWGLWLMAVTQRRHAPPGKAILAVAILVVSVVVVAFYLCRGQIDRNYGGVSSGFRWVFWLAPLWVVATVPAADALSRHRAGRVLTLVLLGLSVVSVAYPTWNPWSPPWIEQWMRHIGSLPTG
jgi:hypothetical protein